jgi:cysteine desulfurase
MRKSAKVQAAIHGGSQERSMRAGTENVAGIIGMTKAAQLAYENLDIDKAQIKELKAYLIEKVKTELPDIEFNGLVDDSALYTVISLSLPNHSMGSLLLFQLDMLGICVSGGSACSSGASKGSHVIEALGKASDRIPLRVSFSKYNTKEDIDFLVTTLQKLYE